MRDEETTERLRTGLQKLIALTKDRTVRWERQVNSAHRYARWKNHLLILGPDTPLSDPAVPRYLFVTPFDSPSHIEINTNDAELGPLLRELVAAVESVTGDEPPTDPFAMSPEFLSRLTD